MSKFLKEFKDFALKGNMIDMAVGIIIGGAFNGLVKSLVENLVMPAISLVTGKIDFSNMFIALDGNHYTTLEAAREATSTISYGLFLTEVINFIIMAFVVFCVVKQLNRLRRKPEEAAPAAPTEKECPFCRTSIAINATRCPHCTSMLGEPEGEAETPL
ncbi:MAG: large conductance mechanosensitive channel protein MscL [Lachnospiraceae bacterium]|jgi:large conductance mechanosensitive channel|nr:large conductance mechanosensitive channel protein MscL [Lachnospiraceae bacterium]MCI8960336.1 large conductance mechanosensitive channel protein MscL [Lachnospiraceae bacterium]